LLINNYGGIKIGRCFLTKLYPVQQIATPGFSGKILIDGDLTYNSFMMRFLFEMAEMVHPLLIWIKVSPITSLKKHGKPDTKTHVLECNIPDINNPVMKTGLIYPEFPLKKSRIRVIKIQSQTGIEWSVYG